MKLIKTLVLLGVVLTAFSNKSFGNPNEAELSWFDAKVLLKASEGALDQITAEYPSIMLNEVKTTITKGTLKKEGGGYEKFRFTQEWNVLDFTGVIGECKRYFMFYPDTNKVSVVSNGGCVWL